MALPPQVLEDSTETLGCYAPLEVGLGALQSVTVRVRTPSTSLPAVDDAEAATADTTSTTVATAAARGATTLTVASASGIDEGRAYVIGLGAVDDDFVVVDVRRVVGSVITLKEPLPILVPADSTLRGYRVSHALTADETKDRGEGVARWEATYASGQKRLWDQQFRVVGQRLHHTLTPSRLTQKYPIVHRFRPPNDEKLQEVIDTAWEDRVVPALEAKQIDIWTIKSAARLEQVVAAACVHHLVSMTEGADLEFVERMEKEYTNQMETALRGRHFWVDVPDELEPRDENAAPGRYEFTEYVR